MNTLPKATHIVNFVMRNGEVRPLHVVRAWDLLPATPETAVATVAPRPGEQVKFPGHTTHGPASAPLQHVCGVLFIDPAVDGENIPEQLAMGTEYRGDVARTPGSETRSGFDASKPPAEGTAYRRDPADPAYRGNPRGAGYPGDPNYSGDPGGYNRGDLTYGDPARRADVPNVAAAQQRVTDAQKKLDDAQHTINVTASPTPEQRTARDTARKELDQAKSDLTGADRWTNQGSGNRRDLGSTHVAATQALAEAQLAFDEAQRSFNLGQPGDKEKATAQAVLDAAKKRLDDAKAAVHAAEGRTDLPPVRDLAARTSPNPNPTASVRGYLGKAAPTPGGEYQIWVESAAYDATGKLPGTWNWPAGA